MEKEAVPTDREQNNGWTNINMQFLKYKVLPVLYIMNVFFIISLINVYKPSTTQCITSSPNLKAAKPCTSNCHQQYQLQKRKTNIVY